MKAIHLPSGDQLADASSSRAVVSASTFFDSMSKMERWLRLVSRYPETSRLNWYRSITIGFGVFFSAVSFLRTESVSSSRTSARRLESGDHWYSDTPPRI